MRNGHRVALFATLGGIGCGVFVGCSARVDDEPPLPSASIIRSKVDPRAPFATPNSAAPEAAPRPTLAPATPPPVPPAVASGLAVVPWKNLDRFKLGAMDAKGDVGVSFTPPLVMGAPYAAADVSAAVEAFSLNYKTCWASSKSAAVEAKLNAHFSLSPRGRPAEIEVTTNLPAGEAKDALVRCVKPWISRVELAPPEGGTPTIAVQMVLTKKPVKLAGVALAELTLDGLKGALQTLGCRRVTDGEGESPKTVTAQCPRDAAADPKAEFDPETADALMFVFVPASASASHPELPGEATRKKCLEEGAVLESAGAFVGVLATPEPLAAPAWLERLMLLPEAQPL